MSTGYHEPHAELSAEARDVHRALATLIEELEAVDWYLQRIDVTPDEELKAVLTHLKNEEIEHASMVLEWVRRRVSPFDEQLRTYLFTKAPIVSIEAAAEGGAGGSANGEMARGLGLGKFKREG